MKRTKPWFLLRTFPKRILNLSNVAAGLVSMVPSRRNHHWIHIRPWFAQGLEAVFKVYPVPWCGWVTRKLPGRLISEYFPSPVQANFGVFLCCLYKEIFCGFGVLNYVFLSHLFGVFPAVPCSKPSGLRGQFLHGGLSVHRCICCSFERWVRAEDLATRQRRSGLKKIQPVFADLFFGVDNVGLTARGIEFYIVTMKSKLGRNGELGRNKWEHRRTTASKHVANELQDWWTGCSFHGSWSWPC